ncbi:transposase [Aquisalimonas sp. 2447]|uniref:transposase n=1 Tax=Aquisalimonas sp. 2447 TaxID=2740807 RepID=UPI0014325CF3|nr:transposase [Aquisalimonas sp. 2447]QIT54471.1 transposase [Aquisalimonas sp. 2447]
MDWHVAMNRGQRRALTKSSLDRMREATETAKAKVRAGGEHAFHVVKNLFGHRKVRYRGIAKNEAQLYALFGLKNLVLAQRRVPALQGRSPF